MQILSRLM
jgi:hypothetical protein